MTAVGCAVGPPITGQLNLEGISVLGLVNTDASVTCMGFLVWWQYRTQWGPLKPFEGVVHGAHGKPLQIAGKTQHLNRKWGEARGRASFIVIIGLKSPPVLIGTDIMRPLQVHIDVTEVLLCLPSQIHKLYTSMPPRLQPPPPPRPPVSCSLLLQAVDIPAETAQLVRCHNPWPSEDVYFCPEEGLPTFVSGVPPSPVDPRFGSPSTITAPNLSAYTQDKPWAPSRSLPSLTRHHRLLPPARTASPLFLNIYHQLSSRN